MTCRPCGSQESLKSFAYVRLSQAHRSLLGFPLIVLEPQLLGQQVGLDSFPA